MISILGACLLTAVVSLLLSARAHYLRLTNLQRKLFDFGLASIVALGIAALAAEVFVYTRHPPQWDMLIFWINGTVASRGLNFYDPVLATQLAAPFHPAADFIAEALGAPFLYPPPSIVWFVPLGWFDIHTATLLWYIAQLTCLAAAIVILSRTFFPARSANDLLFTAALMLLLYGTYLNVKTAQTVFLLLLFLTLAFRDRNRFRGGIWLALAILVKPFAAVVLLYSLCRRKWQPLAGTIATLLVAALASFLILGRNVFLGYTKIDFAALPMSMYTELENQSLLAWILRITHAQTRYSPAYLAIAALLGALALWRLLTAKQATEASAFALALLFGMVVYPASLRSYAVLLILPILILRNAGLRASIALAYGLLLLASGEYTILATLAIGIMLAIKMPASGVTAGDIV